MSTIYLALGSNLGDRAHNLRSAIDLLAPEVTVQNISSVYETKPQYVREQPLFLNAALQATTSLAPHDLLSFLKSTEEKVGRIPSFPNGPRTVDLDILLYDDVVLHSPTLTIPHPRMSERAFVLTPLNDIARDVLHPIQKTTIRELLNALPSADDDVRKADIEL